jgi:hypothetical protein
MIHLGKRELCCVSCISLAAWIIILMLPGSKTLIQLVATLQSISYILISFSFLRRNGFFVSSWPYAILGSVWFLYIDLMLGKYVAPDHYVAQAGFTSTLFMTLVIFMLDISLLKLNWLRVKTRSFKQHLSIYPLRYFAFFVPLLVQAVIANHVGISQFVLLFGGRSSGFTFWGSPLIPFSVSTLLTPLYFIFSFVPALVARNLFSLSSFLKSPGDFVLFTLPLLTSFSSGSRNTFLATIIPVGLVLLVYSRKSMQLFLIIAVLIFLPFGLQYQVTNRGLINPESLEINRNQELIGGADIISTHRDNNIDVFSSALWSRETGMLKGSDYNEIIIASLQFLPRAVFPFKPQSRKLDYDTGAMGIDEGYLSRFIGGKTTASLSLTIPGDFFYAGGWSGIILGSAIYTVMLNLMNRLFEIFCSTFIAAESLAFSSFVSFVALYSFRAYSATTVYLTPLLYIVILLLLLAKLRVLGAVRSSSFSTFKR